MLKRAPWWLVAAGAAAVAAAVTVAKHQRQPLQAAPVLDAPPTASAPLAAPARAAAAAHLPAATGLSAADLAAVRPIFAAFATGDFVGALRLAEAARDHPPLTKGFSSWLDEQMPVLLASAGWALLKVGDCDQARVAFERCLALKPMLEATKGQALCHYKQKNMSVARDYFLSYLAEAPGDPEMQLLYTDVLESEARFTEAVGILKQLVQTAAPADKAPFQQRLSAMEGRAQESILEQVETSQHFRLTYRAVEQAELAPVVLGTLEDAAAEFSEHYGLLPPLAQIEVVLYPRTAFRGMVSNGPSWAEGLFDGRLRIPVPTGVMDAEESFELQTVLRHELVHALIAQMSDSRSLPPWFDEGLAQRLACAQRACAVLSFGPQPGEFLPEAAFMSSYLSLSAVSAGRAYHQSLFLIMTIEAKYGAGSLRQILSHSAVGGRIDSDALLAPVNGRFAEIYTAAKDFWHQRMLPVASL